uniref:Dynein axonemal heavy chain 14 n=1 Tax=Varanus komodoensis TaxID=61221 RepID=A0A8D2LM47_VARKO
KADYDPYDLQVVSTHVAKQSKEYWTITASYVSKIDTSYTYTLEEFCEKQFQQSQQALAQIQTFKDKVIKVIRSAFLRVAEMKGAEWLFQHLSDDVTEKPKHFEIAGWRHVMERFSRFLQLVDRIFQELLRKLVHNALNRLMEIFKGSSNLTVLKVKTNEELIRSFNLFVTHTRSSPILNCILEEVKNQLKGEEEYSPIFEVNICLRIPYEKDYRRKYYQGSDDYIQETPLNSLKEILEHDENLKTSSQCNTENKCEEQSENTQESNILTLLALQSCSLTQVESYSRNFMEYCNMVDKAKHITDRISALRREMSTHEFRNILEHYTADTMETVSMIIERRISMCKVKSLNFQTDCLPYFEALLNVIHSHFYAAIDAKNQHLVEFECLSELYSIAKDYDIFLPLQQLALYQTVVRTLQNLQSAVLICEKTKDDYIIKFNEGLGEYVDNLQVRNPVLLLSETLPKTAKEMIESLIEEAAVISEKIVKYANYQTVFDNSISDMKSLSLEKLSHSGQSGDSQRVNAELSEIESELALRKLLWDSQEESSKKEINEVSITATNETTLEVMLKKIIALWCKTNFHLSPYHTESSSTLIISSAEDITALLEDSQVTISTIKGSCYVGPIKSQIMFTEECETDLRCSNPKKEMIAGRDDLISLLEQLAEIASDILPYHKQTTLEALVILFIHCRDVLTTMIDHEIYNVEHFEWTRQLRYEWHELSPCKVIQGYASFEYGYEYLGCSPRLVITPLTDRCWLTVTGALQLNLGGCLAGPAGTGKTETVKDLSKVSVEPDDFPFFLLSYKGRVELPDNLKSLFRPVSMMVPDYELIAEIMLFSEGFKSARTLSGKIVNLYHLCSKQLSQQDHYDFGMRAIKTVLLRAGQKRQENKKKKFSAVEEIFIMFSVLKEVNLPKFLAEDVLLFEDIMKDLFPEMRVPKVSLKRLEGAISLAIQLLGLQPWESQIAKVIQFYNQIVACVGVMLVGPTGGGKTTIRSILEKALMVLPLMEMDSGTKIDVKGKVDTFVINPKCVTLGELFGETNTSTMEWSDGLLSSAFSYSVSFLTHIAGNSNKCVCTRVCVFVCLFVLDEAITDWQWIILDGPVDPSWIENLNSVLDDTRMLCLANGERIYLSPGIRMVFEVDSLSQASPATVSRCAMVYVDPVDLGWEPYVKTWLEGFSEIIAQSDMEYLESLFHSSIKGGMDFLNKHKNMQAFPVHQMGIVMNICRIVGSFIHIIKESGGFTVSFCTEIKSSTSQFSGVTEESRWFWEKHPNKLPVLLGKLFIFAFTWAVGGVLRREEEHEGETLIGINTSQDDLAKVTRDFNYLVHDTFERKPPANIQIPTGDKTIFDYFVDMQSGEFAPWAHLVPTTQFLIQKGKNIYHKPILLHFYFNFLANKKRTIVSTLQLGTHTSATQAKALILQKLILKSKDILDVPHSKQALLFIDDLNAPIPEEYGSQPPLELIRQLLDLGGFYDTRHLDWKNVLDIALVANCTPPSEGSNGISARLLTHFCTLVLPATSLQSLQRIFQVGLDGNGKVTSASLACYLSECSLYKLSISRTYNHGNFRDDLKAVYKKAGLEGKRTVFLITDSDIIQESFLEDLSCILKSGQVPNLFEKEELDNIIVPLTSLSHMILSSFQRVRTNLHVVFTTSAAGLVFRQRCRTYPAIVNCCTIDWYDAWPEEALCHVAKSYFRENLDMDKFICVNIHKNVSVIIEKYLKETKRHYYITPNSYLQFINTFSTILKFNFFLTCRACYNSGLTKILEATSQITDMQDELFVLGPQIEKKSKEIEELVERLHKDALVVEQVRTIVKQDEETMAAETRIVEEYAEQVTEELNAVLPSLEKALAALDALDKNHIAEIRVYTRPPPLVLTVMNAVCVLLQKKPNWTTAKLLLADPGFLKRLVTLDKDNLPEKVFLQLKKYIKSPDFSPVKVGLVSIACCSMCQWILALDHYHIVKKFVDPKQAKVSEAEELLKLAHEKLAEKQRSLVLVRRWQNAGLPLDQYSTENAIYVKHGQRWPLLIDPERQAYKWICQMAGGKLRQIRITDVNYLRTLENAMRTGESVLLQVSHDACWSKKPSAELYLTTRKANPHFLPAVCNTVTMINFTVTFQGLQDQLLSAVVIKEQPELEQKRCELLESISSDLVTLRELEQKSLRLLQKTNGHLLDDQDLIDNLQRTKLTSTEIFERVEASAATEAKITTLRESYLPIATRGAMLYFVVSDLVHINYMYQFSLEWFQKIFADSVDYMSKQKSEASLSSSSSFRPASIQPLRRFVKYSDFLFLQTVSSALFSENQLCFAFLLCTAIMKNNHDETQFTYNIGFISEDQWNFFLHSMSELNIYVILQLGSCAFMRIPPLPWITETMWKECQYMSAHMPAFSLLCDSLSSDFQQWNAFLSSQEVYYLISTSYRPSEEENTKEQYDVLRLESLNSAVRAFVIEKLGTSYLRTGGINLKAVYEESDRTTPLILIHTHGEAYLRSLPDVDSPELFGMHHCAEVAYLKTQAQLFVDAVVSTQPAVTTDTLIIRRSQDEIVLEIASDILIRLPLTVEDTGCMITSGFFSLFFSIGPGSFIKSTLLTVLHQEIDQYNNLLAIIIKSLHALQQGIKGEIIFTTGIEELYNSILKAKVPELWQHHSYKSCKPLGSWIDDLIIRVSMCSIPAGFLTAVLQNYARQKKIPVDSLYFVHQVVQAEDQEVRTFKQKDSILSKAFKVRAQEEVQHKKFCVGRPRDLIALLFFKTDLFSRPSNLEEEAGLLFYKCPLYRTPQRSGILSSTGISTNFITAVRLPTLTVPSHWITRGVALLCQLDD